MSAFFEYRRSDAPEPARNPLARRGLAPRIAALLLCLGCLIALPECRQEPRQELDGTYVTRNGLARLSFRPGRQYLFQDQLVDLSITGAYHMADARKIILELPLRRADESLGPPLLIRHRDELRLYKSDGEVVRFYRQRDERDGPDPLLGELDPEEEEDELEQDAAPDAES